jgi:hypothetical protein
LLDAEQALFLKRAIEECQARRGNLQGNRHFDTWLACAKDLRYKQASFGESKVLVKLVVSE